jgi:tetratricopeptide (TPR) repeat protein
MQAQTDSSRAPDTYASDWSAGIKVYIPNTSVSISDAYRYLANWLGSQTHISGEVYHTAAGIAVTARAGGNAGVTFEGRESQLPKLMQQAAESIYHQTQPFRYAIYVGTSYPSPQGNIKQMKILGDLALNGPDSEKPWAYTVWSYGAINLERNLSEALRRARTAVSYDPDLPLAVSNLAVFEKIAGQDALAVADGHRTLKTLDGSGAGKIIPRAAAAFRPQFKAFLAEETGDWNAALAQYEALRSLADFEGLHGNSLYASAADLALLHDPRASRAIAPGSDADLESATAAGFGWQLVNLIWPAYTRASMAGDWAGARRDLLDVLNTHTAKLPYFQLLNRMQIWPWLALADAHVGRSAEAWSLIGKTPRDCYDCTRIRGRIDTARHNWSGAGYWFAQAVHQAPDIPFAYADWGAMLMAKGDFDGAIAKFARASKHGPHFADPREMWGEALIAKDRADLALAKFADADRYAPKWGRLHLKWGEALLWSGDEADAKRQFAIASRLDLTKGEASQLKRMTATHV